MKILRVIRSMSSNLVYVSTFIFPWPIRRILLNSIYNYQIDPKARIKFAWIRPRSLIMGAHSKIDHLTVVKSVDLVELGEHASIGRLNWISGFPSGSQVHFVSDVDRKPVLILGDHSAITHRHIIDCTNEIHIGEYSTVAGHRSQFLTHSIDVKDNKQRSHPISIGAFSFIGTGVILLGGSAVPARSVLAAGAVLSKKFTDEYTLYAGVPAKPVKQLDKASLYFSRKDGFVY